jgi:hypothetical protein
MWAISARHRVVLVSAAALLATRQPLGGRLLTVVGVPIWQTDDRDGKTALVGPAYSRIE